MKKHLLILALLCLPFALMAKEKRDDTKYLAGAVPEENGIITFKKSFTVTDKSTDQIYDILLGYMRQEMVGKAIHDKETGYTRIISEEKGENTIVARIEEYMTFTHVFLNLDRTRFRYQFIATVNGQKVNLKLTQVSYYYNEDMEGKNGQLIKGEEWITDALAINKKGTKLYPRSGKFRRKTVDRVEAIFDSIMDAIANSEVAQETQVVVKKRKGIVED